MKVTAKAPEITNIEPGVYPAVLAKAEYLDASKTKFGNAQFKFVFTVEDVLTSEGGPVQLNFWANAKLTPKSKLWSVVEALGTRPAIGEEVDLDEFLGAPCALFVDKERDAQGQEWPRIQSVLPASRLRR